MPCEVSFPFEYSITLVTLERIFPSVCPHVSLQSRWLSASIVALVTLVRFFFSMLFVWSFNSNVVMLEKSHIVQLCCFSSECVLLCLFKVLDCFVFTLIAMEGFLSNMCPPVLLQVVWLWCFVITLIAIKEFFPGVLFDMRFEVRRMFAWEAALCALVRFLPRVNECVFLQPIKPNDFLYCGQLYFLTLLWVCLWWESPFLLVNLFRHKSQEISLDILKYRILFLLNLAASARIS